MSVHKTAGIPEKSRQERELRRRQADAQAKLVGMVETLHQAGASIYTKKGTITVEYRDAQTGEMVFWTLTQE